MVHNEVVKNTKLQEKIIHDGTTWIHINQYDTDQQNLEKKTGYADKKCQIRVV